MSESDRRRAKEPPARPADPRYRRTCTRCGHVRFWTVARCPKCKNPEFTVPPEEPGP